MSGAASVGIVLLAPLDCRASNYGTGISPAQACPDDAISFGSSSQVDNIIYFIFNIPAQHCRDDRMPALTLLDLILISEL